MRCGVADDLEQGPDPNDIRRHAKKMLTEIQYRQKYRRLDFYRPNFKQEEFHNLRESEKMLRAGNQNGKTHATSAEDAMHAIAFYPDWFKGRKFLKAPEIERPFEFVGWYGCTTSGMTRDGVQTKLLGDLRTAGGLGTGMIPLDNIVGRPTMARGISDFVDTINLTRETGGKAVFRGKTFEMGREAWQVEAVDLIHGDEDPGDFEIYEECQARLTTTRGQIIWSMTPVRGATPVRKHFKNKSPGTAEILMTIWDAAVSKRGHIPDEDIPGIIARYGSKAATRAFGGDAQGQGAVFETEADQIKHTLKPTDAPDYWPWLWALDFRHSGQESGGHPFAAVLLTWDRDNDVVYVMDGFRLYGMAASHVARIKENPMWRAPVAWPHDGGVGAGVQTNDTIATIYKKLGLNMLPTHATFDGKGYNLEAGLAVMEERFAAKKLLVAGHFFDWFDEYGGYHRKDGKVVKVDDDLLSATRVGCMDLRFAKTTERFRAFASNQPEVIAAGTDFDVFTGV
jgi:phage terminase large subunit-like protein